MSGNPEQNLVSITCALVEAFEGSRIDDIETSLVRIEQLIDQPLITIGTGYIARSLQQLSTHFDDKDNEQLAEAYRESVSSIRSKLAGMLPVEKSESLSPAKSDSQEKVSAILVDKGSWKKYDKSGYHLGSSAILLETSIEGRDPEKLVEALLCTHCKAFEFGGRMHYPAVRAAISLTRNALNSFAISEPDILVLIAIMDEIEAEIA